MDDSKYLPQYVFIYGRDEIRIEPLIIEGVTRTRIRVVGCADFLRVFKSWHQSQGAKKPQDWSLPEGRDHGSLLLREAILRYRGSWNLPYQDVEICHCRQVTTQTVSDAIRNGAHDLEGIRRMTTANTSCGSCRRDIEAVLQYHLAAARSDN